MMSGFGDATKIPELRKRIFFTLLMLVVYRLAVFVPTPGIDVDKLKSMFERAAGTLFGIANMFSGGALENFSVLALGIMPYISMSIIIQLLTTSIPHLEALSKEGEQGRRIITRYTRIGTVFLALFQSFVIARGLESQGVVADPGWGFRLLTMITLTAGTAFIMWLGEQITENGIGNGMSIIIFAGIVARVPSSLSQTFALVGTGELTPFALLALLVFSVLTVALIVFVERTYRKIPVQYPRRAVGKNIMQASTQYLPLKLNLAGVIPPIFASSVLVVPATFAQFSSNESLQKLASYFQHGTWVYESIFVFLIIFFAYFYTAIIYDPNQIADNLKKNGGFIPTVRPGKETAEYLDTILSRLTFWGGIYISVICVVPILVYAEFNASQFAYFLSGTAVLIMVGVMLDTANQIQSHIVARNYEGFLAKGPGKVRGGLSRAMQSRSGGRLIQR
ncbi:preprotein translocase subunit SecY [bacterium]|nr:preprotein translocase subunit SecY [bacterium]